MAIILIFLTTRILERVKILGRIKIFERVKRWGLHPLRMRLTLEKNPYLQFEKEKSCIL